MSWQINTTSMPSIRSFTEAEAFFNKTAPVKSSNWGEYQRPLAGRSACHKRIEKHTPPNGETVYELILYSTPLVTYRDNGEITVMTHNSNSSHAFMWGLLPAGLRPHGHHGHMMIHANTEQGPAWYSGDVMRFAPVGDKPGVWSLKNGDPKRIREVLCRKSAAQIRKAAKPFLAWAHGTRALLNKPKLSDAWSFAPSETFPHTLVDLTDPEKWAGFESALPNDVSAWYRTTYKKLGALTEQSISPFEPPKRGSSPQFS